MMKSHIDINYNNRRCVLQKITFGPPPLSEGEISGLPWLSFKESFPQTQICIKGEVC